jgi:uncharacterized protein YjcR
MEEIYRLRQKGKTWKEIMSMLTVSITQVCLYKRFKRWCVENNKQLEDGRKKNAGRPPKEIKLK